MHDLLTMCTMLNRLAVDCGKGNLTPEEVEKILMVYADDLFSMAVTLRKTIRSLNIATTAMTGLDDDAIQVIMSKEKENEHE